MNNPSNPCGSNYSADHLRAICAVAKRHNLPIISDEVYNNVVFLGDFVPMADVCDDVPVLTVAGTAKQFVVPGWRVGWVVVYDRSADKRASLLLSGMKSLSQLILGANSVVQSCLPRLLLTAERPADKEAMDAFHAKYMSILRNNAELCSRKVRELNEHLRTAHPSVTADVLTITQPSGAMYAMVGVNAEIMDDAVKDDTDFARLLLQEENVSLLPGQCFGMKNFFRLVLSGTEEILCDALQRIEFFCTRHLKA